MRPIVRQGRSRAIAIVALLTLAAPAAASSSCALDATRKPFYHLEFTVPATFCRTHAEDLDCKALPKPDLVQLHGLWVDYETGAAPLYPVGRCTEPGCDRLDAPGANFCADLPDLPALYGSAMWAREAKYFTGPTKCMERHEWVKHGTCTPMDVVTWAQWGLDRVAEFLTRVAPPADAPIASADFDRRVADALPEWSGALNFVCSGGALLSFHIDYDWGATPGAIRYNQGRINAYQDCGATFTIPSKP